MFSSRQHVARFRSTVLTLIALPLFIGCDVNPFADETTAQDEKYTLGDGSGPLTFAFKTHVVAKSDALAGINQNLLNNIDTIILGQQNLPHLEQRHLSKATLYFNMWGMCRYLDIGEWPKYQIAPGDLGEPDIVMNGGVHCYRFDDAHVARFLGWIENYLQTHAGEVRGVFLDDFGYSRRWWSGDEQEKDLIWGPMDGRPGWRDDLCNWNLERVRAIEAGALALVRQYCGQDGVVIVNGSARSLDGVWRFAEDVGTPNNESWERLEIEGVSESHYARAGDMLQVNGVGVSGVWGDWTDTYAGNGWDNLLRACNLAVERDLSVGLAYGEIPPGGSTMYSLYWDPCAPGAEWPGFMIYGD